MIIYDYFRLKKKKCYVSDFPTDWSKSAPTATFLALRKKKKKKVGDRPCSTIPVFIKSQNHFVTRICPRRFSDIFGL